MSDNNLFDLIISNPPYKQGNLITQNSIDNCKEAVILMPAAKYKVNNLFQHIDSIEIVDKKFFKDKHQDIKPDLSICKLNHNKDTSILLENVLDRCLLEDIQEFLKLNRQLVKKFDRITYTHKLRLDYESNKKLYFMVPYWQHVGTASSEKSITKKFNNNESSVFDKVLNSDMCYSVIKFSLAGCWDNFYEWYYNNDIQNYILLNCLDLPYPSYLWFPQIDFSIDRDYKNITFDQLLKTMQETLDIEIKGCK